MFASTPRSLPFAALSITVLPAALALLTACSGGGEAPDPSPPASAGPTSVSLNAGQPGGALGGLPGGNNGPGIGGPGNAPGLGAPGNVPVPATGAAGFAAGRPAAASPGAAPAAAGGGDITTMFFGKPSEGVKPSETIHGAGGVFAGLPVNWSSSDWNTDGYTDQCVYLFPKSAQQAHEMCLKQVTAQPNQTDLRREAYAAMWDKAEFEAPVDGKAGFQGHPAKIYHGKGISVVRGEGDREGYAVWVQIPNKKNVLILGSWPVKTPAVKQIFVDIVKGLGPCTFKPQKGCVPDATY